MAYDKIPPQHLNSEQALLGSMLLRSDVYDQISDIITTKSFFYSNKHQVIFEAIQKVANSKNQVDSITVGKQLEDDDLLSTVGGQSYISELTSLVPSASHAMTYAQTVKELAVKRNLIKAGEEISALGYQSKDGVDEVLNDAEEKIFKLSGEQKNETYMHITKGVESMIDRLVNMSENTDGIRGISTGFDSLDRKLSGFQKSDLIILAARPSTGKTAFALDIARKMAVEKKIPVGIFSLEMSNDQLIERMIAAEAFIDAWTLRTGHAMKKEDTREQIIEVANDLQKAPIYIDDRPGLNILNLRSTARRMKREHDVQAIIVDYLQLINPHQTARSESMVQQVTEISRTLKHIARELSIPVIALSQLSREIEKRSGEPRLADLRDSGSIEQDADIVAFLHKTQGSQQDAGDGPLPIDLIISKHRNGPVGRLHFSFNRQKITFQEIDTNTNHANMEAGIPHNTDTQQGY